MAGGFDRFKITLTQVGERIGMKLVPQIDKLGTWLVDKALPAAARLGNTLRRELGPALSAVGGFITGKVVPAAQSLFKWYVEKIAPGIVKMVTPIINGLRTAFEKVSDKVGENEGQLKKIGEVLKNVAEFIADKVAPVVGKVLGKAFETMGTVIGGAIDVISTLVDWLTDAKNAVESLIGWIGKIDIPDIDIPLIGGSAGGLVTIGHELIGQAPSYDSRRGWSSASTGLAGLVPAMRQITQLAPAGAQVIDARTFLSVAVDGSGIVDERRVAAALTDVLKRHADRLGRPVLTTTIGF
jgi:hypothetical protein